MTKPQRHIRRQITRGFILHPAKSCEYSGCTCGDFLYRGQACWHLLAGGISRDANRFETVYRWYQETLKNGRA